MAETTHDFTFELAHPELVIENEIAQGCTQKQIAQTYRLAMQSSWPTDWARVNQAILKRWPKGLQRVKEMAWSGKCFQPTTPPAARGERV